VRRLAGGYSVLEFLVAVILIGSMMLAFLDRVDFYRESAERTAMEQLAREIGWALRIRTAELMLANRNDEIGLLEDANPVEALDLRLGGYAGAGSAAGEASVPPGSWYFDRDSRELVYFPALTSNFFAPARGRARVAWRVVVVREAAQPGGRPRPQWVRLELATPYRWFDKNQK